MSGNDAQIPHSGEPLNWVGVSFILFWMLAGTLFTLVVTESVWWAVAIGWTCEYVSALIANHGTKYIRIYLEAALANENVNG